MAIAMAIILYKASYYEGPGIIILQVHGYT